MILISNSMPGHLATSGTSSFRWCVNKSEQAWVTLLHLKHKRTRVHTHTHTHTNKHKHTHTKCCAVPQPFQSATRPQDWWVTEDLVTAHRTPHVPSPARERNMPRKQTIQTSSKDLYRKLWRWEALPRKAPSANYTSIRDFQSEHWNIKIKCLLSAAK